MNELTIKIFEATDEEGFFYDIYDTVEVDDDTESLDGGMCTGTLQEALSMAYDQAQAILLKDAVGF